MEYLECRYLIPLLTATAYEEKGKAAFQAWNQDGAWETERLPAGTDGAWI